MKEVTKEQRTEEWFEARRQGITATDIVAIMGESPFKTPSDVYYSKIEGLESADNEYTKYGRDNEERGIRSFIDMIEPEQYKFPGLVMSDENELFLASPDVMVSKNFEWILGEIKCPYSQELPTDLPYYYYLQCQWQMLVTGTDKAVLFYWIENGVKWFDIERNNDLIETMKEYAITFWNEHITKKIPPKDDKPTLFIQDLDEDKQNEWVNLTSRYKELSDIEKRISKEKKEIKNLIFDLTGGMRAKGFGASVSISYYKRKDYKTACENAGIEPILKEPSRVTRITVR